MSVSKVSLRVLSSEDVVCDRNDTAQFIASGGFADIFRGTLDGIVPVAVKYAKPIGKISALNSDTEEPTEKYYQSLLKEANIMLILASCPNVTRVYGVQNDPVTNVCNVLVMELAVCTLNEILFISGSNHAKFPTPSIGCVTTLLLDCAKGIDFLHTHNVVHNDIKPDNMLIYADGTLKLTDFGLATDASDAAIHSTNAHHNHHTNQHKKHNRTDKDIEPVTIPTPAVLCKGNAIYQAPEMFIAPPRCSTASDIYAFGIVLNEVLTGQRPLNHMLVTLLPVQICGGIRPTPVFGDDIDKPRPLADSIFTTIANTTTTSPATNTIDIDTPNTTTTDSQDALRIQQTRSQECDEDTTKRLRHLIHTCWGEDCKSRPHASAVVGVLARLLEGMGGEQREQVKCCIL